AYSALLDNIEVILMDGKEGESSKISELSTKFIGKVLESSKECLDKVYEYVSAKNDEVYAQMMEAARRRSRRGGFFRRLIDKLTGADKARLAGMKLQIEQSKQGIDQTMTAQVENVLTFITANILIKLGERMERKAEQENTALQDIKLPVDIDKETVKVLQQMDNFQEVTVDAGQGYKDLNKDLLVALQMRLTKLQSMEMNYFFTVKMLISIYDRVAQLVSDKKISKTETGALESLPQMKWDTLNTILTKALGQYTEMVKQLNAVVTAQKEYELAKKAASKAMSGLIMGAIVGAGIGYAIGGASSALGTAIAGAKAGAAMAMAEVYKEAVNNFQHFIPSEVDYSNIKLLLDQMTEISERSEARNHEERQQEEVNIFVKQVAKLMEQGQTLQDQALAMTDQINSGLIKSTFKGFVALDDKGLSQIRSDMSDRLTTQMKLMMGVKIIINFLEFVESVAAKGNYSAQTDMGILDSIKASETSNIMLIADFKVDTLTKMMEDMNRLAQLELTAEQLSNAATQAITSFVISTALSAVAKGMPDGSFGQVLMNALSSALPTIISATANIAYQNKLIAEIQSYLNTVQDSLILPELESEERRLAEKKLVQTIAETKDLSEKLSARIQLAEMQANKPLNQMQFSNMTMSAGDGFKTVNPAAISEFSTKISQNYQAIAVAYAQIQTLISFNSFISGVVGLSGMHGDSLSAYGQTVQMQYQTATKIFEYRMTSIDSAIEASNQMEEARHSIEASRSSIMSAVVSALGSIAGGMMKGSEGAMFSKLSGLLGQALDMAQVARRANAGFGELTRNFTSLLNLNDFPVNTGDKAADKRNQAIRDAIQAVNTTLVSNVGKGYVVSNEGAYSQLQGRISNVFNLQTQLIEAQKEIADFYSLVARIAGGNSMDTSTTWEMMNMINGFKRDNAMTIVSAMKKVVDKFVERSNAMQDAKVQMMNTMVSIAMSLVQMGIGGTTGKESLGNKLLESLITSPLVRQMIVDSIMESTANDKPEAKLAASKYDNADVSEAEAEALSAGFPAGWRGMMKATLGSMHMQSLIQQSRILQGMVQMEGAKEDIHQKWKDQMQEALEDTLKELLQELVKGMEAKSKAEKTGVAVPVTDAARQGEAALAVPATAKPGTPAQQGNLELTPAEEAKVSNPEENAQLAVDTAMSLAGNINTSMTGALSIFSHQRSIASQALIDSLTKEATPAQKDTLKTKDKEERERLEKLEANLKDSTRLAQSLFNQATTQAAPLNLVSLAQAVQLSANYYSSISEMLQTMLRVKGQEATLQQSVKLVESIIKGAEVIQTTPIRNVAEAFAMVTLLQHKQLDKNIADLLAIARQSTDPDIQALVKSIEQQIPAIANLNNNIEVIRRLLSNDLNLKLEGSPEAVKGMAKNLEEFLGKFYTPKEATKLSQAIMNNKADTIAKICATSKNFNVVTLLAALSGQMDDPNLRKLYKEVTSKLEPVFRSVLKNAMSITSEEKQEMLKIVSALPGFKEATNKTAWAMQNIEALKTAAGQGLVYDANADLNVFNFNEKQAVRAAAPQGVRVDCEELAIRMARFLSVLNVPAEVIITEQHAIVVIPDRTVKGDKTTTGTVIDLTNTQIAGVKLDGQKIAFVRNEAGQICGGVIGDTSVVKDIISPSLVVAQNGKMFEQGPGDVALVLHSEDGKTTEVYADKEVSVADTRGIANAIRKIDLGSAGLLPAQNDQVPTDVLARLFDTQAQAKNAGQQLQTAVAALQENLLVINKKLKNNNIETAISQNILEEKPDQALAAFVPVIAGLSQLSANDRIQFLPELVRAFQNSSDVLLAATSIDSHVTDRGDRSVSESIKNITTQSLAVLNTLVSYLQTNAQLEPQEQQQLQNLQKDIAQCAALSVSLPPLSTATTLSRLVAQLPALMPLVEKLSSDKQKHIVAEIFSSLTRKEGPIIETMNIVSRVDKAVSMLANIPSQEPTSGQKLLMQVGQEQATTNEMAIRTILEKVLGLTGGMHSEAISGQLAELAKKMFFQGAQAGDVAKQSEPVSEHVLAVRNTEILTMINNGLNKAFSALLPVEQSAILARTIVQQLVADQGTRLPEAILGKTIQQTNSYLSSFFAAFIQQPNIPQGKDSAKFSELYQQVKDRLINSPTAKDTFPVLAQLAGLALGLTEQQGAASHSKLLSSELPLIKQALDILSRVDWPKAVLGEIEIPGNSPLEKLAYLMNISAQRLANLYQTAAPQDFIVSQLPVMLANITDVYQEFMNGPGAKAKAQDSWVALGTKLKELLGETDTGVLQNSLYRQATELTELLGQAVSENIVEEGVVKTVELAAEALRNILAPQTAVAASGEALSPVKKILQIAGIEKDEIGMPGEIDILTTENKANDIYKIFKRSLTTRPNALVDDLQK
ncbi:MAG: hypothetical protein WC838_01310, partial [Candidatus Margulisiibacteriota bacterium]